MQKPSSHTKNNTTSNTRYLIFPSQLLLFGSSREFPRWPNPLHSNQFIFRSAPLPLNSSPPSRSPPSVPISESTWFAFVFNRQYGSYVFLIFTFSYQGNHGGHSPNHGAQSPNHGGGQTPNHGGHTPNHGGYTPNHGSHTPNHGGNHVKGHQSFTEADVSSGDAIRTKIQRGGQSNQKIIQIFNYFSLNLLQLLQ